LLRLHGMRAVGAVIAFGDDQGTAPDGGAWPVNGSAWSEVAQRPVSGVGPLTRAAFRVGH
jgi:hypothetical protein